MELYDIRQAAKYLGLSESAVRKHCGQGRLGKKVGARWVITHDDLERFEQIPRRVGRPPAEEEGET